jgi:hypothetical protein
MTAKAKYEASQTTTATTNITTTNISTTNKQDEEICMSPDASLEVLVFPKPRGPKPESATELMGSTFKCSDLEVKSRRGFLPGMLSLKETVSKDIKDSG